MIQGLQAIERWLSKEEQRDYERELNTLLSTVPARVQNNDRSRVKRFGWSYESAPEAKPRRLDSWPDWLETLRLRLPYQPSVEGCAITVNEYAPGYRIGPHIDSLKVRAPIQSISLASTARLRFTRQDHEDITLTLAPGTLCLLDSEARYQWKHEILPVDQLRYSIIFREYPALDLAAHAT